MIKAKINKLQKKIERLQKYPALHQKMMQGFACQDAVSMIKSFKKNLERYGYNIAKLHPFTIDMKTEAGYSKPDVPLYGLGKNDPATLYNSLRIRLIKNGARVYVTDKKHHTADMPLKALFKIHEYGCYIPVTEAMRNYLHAMGLHLKQTTAVIVIPPRPVFRIALNEQKKERMKGTKGRKKYIKKAMSEYISKGRTIYINKMAKYVKEAGQYAETD